ncbi:histidine kinase [Arthrobacter mangrovi]|uniref:Histidine kinase n=2 Tax=Arthrobacter mangrovi TaxID=2966350 RepID=A0ABQ5MW34_9MICC|nr:histidine kinase [Arthrobacter mangrovi]
MLLAALDVASDLGIETTMRRLVRSVRSLTDAESAQLRLAVSGDGSRTISATHESPEPRETVDRAGVSPYDDDAPLPRVTAPGPSDTGRRITAALLVHDKEYGRLDLTGKVGGAGFTEEDRAAVACLVSAGSVAIANSLRFDSMRRWLGTSIALSTQLPPKSQDVRELIVNQALRPSAAVLAAVVSPSSDRSFARCEAAAGERAEKVLRKTLALTDSVAGDVLAAGRPRVCRAADLVGEDFADGLGEALLAPLMPRGGEPSLLILCRERGADPFQPLDLEMAEVFCTHAGLAMELTQGQRLREQLVLFADRDRIARDLHDVVIQRLFAAGLSIQSLRRYTDDEAAHQRITGVTQELDEAIRELRDTIYSLQAETEEELSSRLARTVQDGTDSQSAIPRLEINGPVDAAVPDRIADHLVAVATEGVSNAVRHSGATTIDVSVTVEDGIVRLVVQDDGRGFAATRRRSGLANLEQRASDLHGTFKVSSLPGKGTRLSWTAPLPGDDSSETAAELS